MRFVVSSLFFFFFVIMTLYTFIVHRQETKREKRKEKKEKGKEREREKERTHVLLVIILSFTAFQAHEQDSSTIFSYFRNQSMQFRKLSCLYTVSFFTPTVNQIKYFR